MPICQYCEREYDYKSSTEPINVEDLYDEEHFCSKDCEKAEINWLNEGNKTIQNAKENNPSLFARSEMSTSEQQALETIKNVNKAGVKFSKD